MSSPSKAHVSVNVSDLGRAVAFYRALLGVEPAKHHADYAKFELEDPALVLSLEPVFHRGLDAFNHLGVRLGTSDEVRAAQRRVEAAGLSVTAEDDVECCYSRQTKLWVVDPDKNLWEIYTVLDELTERGSLSVSDALAARDRAGAHAGWEHRLGDPIPARIPAEDGALDEVRLRGSFNAATPPAELSALLAEAMRALRPGGQLTVHGLVADRPLEGGFPKLPGPAALVRSVGVEVEVPRLLEAHGFIGVFLQKLAEGPNFSHAGVQMREQMVSAWKPARADAGSGEAEQVVVYRGPFREVIDDAGRRYVRGERVTVSADEAAALRRGPLGDQLVFLRVKPKLRAAR